MQFLKWATLKGEWQRIKKADPGRRFQDRYDRRHSTGGDRKRNRFLFIAGGSLLLLSGAVLRLIPLMPGGSPLLVIGAGLICRESLTAARALDKVEVRTRTAGRRALNFLRRR